MTPLNQIRLLPPLMYPPKIICVARNYAEHAKEAGLEKSLSFIARARSQTGAPVMKSNALIQLAIYAGVLALKHSVWHAASLQISTGAKSKAACPSIAKDSPYSALGAKKEPVSISLA